jgi:hypothetical protein
MLKTLVFLLFLFVFCSSGRAGEMGIPAIEQRLWKLYANADFVSAHIWRGGKSGRSPCVEPLLELGHANFTLGTWSAVSFDGLYKELDLYINYTVGDFTLGLYDYFCPPEHAENIEFANFHGHDTYHLYSFDGVFVGNKNLPVKITLSTMLYGMDFNPETGNYNFSTYLEAKYSKAWRAINWSATMGLTTHSGIYASRAAIVNTEFEIKYNIQLKPFSFPVYSRLIYNPYTNTTFFMGGVAISANYNW